MTIVYQVTLSDICMVVLTFIYVAATIIYVATTISILKSTNKQFEETMRPKVYVDFRFKNAEMYVVVKNVGERAAHNINIKFNPDIKYKIEEERRLNNTPLINNLPFLGPKNELDSILGAGFDILPNQESEKVEAVVNYESEKGEKYREEHSFSLEAYSKRVYTQIKDINDIVDELKKIGSAIEKRKS